jgi:hypothetical protein
MVFLRLSRREVNIRSTRKEYSRLLRDPKFRNLIQMSPKLDHIQSTPSHHTPFRSLLILSSYLRLGSSSGFFLSGFSTNSLFTFLISPMRATCLVHLTFLGLFTVIKHGEQYTIWDSSLCSLLQRTIHDSIVDSSHVSEPCTISILCHRYMTKWCLWLAILVYLQWRCNHGHEIVWKLF